MAGGGLVWGWGWGGSHSSQPMASGMVSLSCQANPRGSELPYTYPCVLPSLLDWVGGWRQWLAGLDGMTLACVCMYGDAISPRPQPWLPRVSQPTLSPSSVPICALASGKAPPCIPQLGVTGCVGGATSVYVCVLSPVCASAWPNHLAHPLFVRFKGCPPGPRHTHMCPCLW